MSHRAVPRQWSKWPLTHALLRAFEAEDRLHFPFLASLAGNITMQRWVDDGIPDIFGAHLAEETKHA